jgi:hypothetical protein
MHFKDITFSAPEIAQRLGVDALVEGSVIRQGSHIRMQAQMIRATDEHFWSETYDREIGDVLALESDFAQSIVDLDDGRCGRWITWDDVCPTASPDGLAWVRLRRCRIYFCCRPKGHTEVTE